MNGRLTDGETRRTSAKINTISRPVETNMGILKKDPVIEQVLTEAGYGLNAIQIRIVGNEALKLYGLHTEACKKAELEPDDFSKFVLEVAEQMRAGIYDSRYRMTEVNDDGCQRLLQAVVVKAERMSRLNNWHRQYVAACALVHQQAYALQLILAAVNATSTPFSLSNDSLSTQTERINALVAEYVKTAGRKENPKWFARPARRQKPSKQFENYVY